MRKLSILVLLIFGSLAATAAVNPGVVAGYVRDVAGKPQMGALVEILSPHAADLVTHTDAHGGFAFSGLLPGLYTVKISAPSFLPTIREKIRLHSGASVLLNLTLNTLFDSLQLEPKHTGAARASNDWRWALRAMANRPILRFADDAPLAPGEDDRRWHAGIALLSSIRNESVAGGTSASFHLERSARQRRSQQPFRWTLNGAIGSAANPSAALRATYTRPQPNGSRPELTVTARRFASVGGQPAIQSLGLAAANRILLGEWLELAVGGETQMMQYRHLELRLNPSAVLSLSASPDLLIQYRFATSVPEAFGDEATGLSETNPHLTIGARGQRLERAMHHELSLARRFGAHKLQLAVYHDSLRDDALAASVARPSADVTATLIGDPFSNLFYFNGGDWRTTGLRAVYAHPLFDGLDVTVDYAYGGTLVAPASLHDLTQAAGKLTTVRRHSLAAQLSGTVPHANTQLRASYRWTSGEALTPVDWCNVSPGRAEPFLSLLLRQPLSHIFPAGFEALVEIQNLLDQGYRPMLSTDGETLYLIQGERIIRAGLVFNF